MGQWSVYWRGGSREEERGRLDVAAHTRGKRSLGAAEAEIERFIERRAQKGETDPDELEPGYMESVRLYHERSEAEMRSRWIDFHQNMHRLHSTLATEHEAKAQKLLEDSEQEGRKQ